MSSLTISKLGVWKQAWGLLDKAEKRRAWRMLVVVVIAALSSAMMVVSIFPFLAVLADPARIHSTPVLQWVYDRFGFENNYSFLVALGLGSLAVIVLSNMIQMLKTYMVTKFTLMQTHSISMQLMDGYLRRPYEFFLDSHSGEMNKTILTESTHVVTHFFRPVAELIAGLLTTLAILSVVIWADPVIALLALLVLAGSYGTIFLGLRKILERLGETRIQSNGARFRIAGETFGGIKDIKILGREYACIARYEGPSLVMADAQVKSNVISSLPQFAVQSVAFAGIILLCLALVDSASYESGASLGNLLPLIAVFAFAGQRLLPELSKIYSSFAKLQFGISVVRHISTNLTAARDLPLLPGQNPARLGMRHALTFDTVHYSYPNAPDRGVHGLSLTIHAGERIGIVGATGAGKTTLADLTLGLLRPQSGHLVVDDTPVTDENLRAWQQSVGYVPQDIFLTDASITNNIALGVPSAQIDQARIEDCARRAQLHDFILSDLPKGYATEIGERGVRLSGGQRQRLGIARALYHNADLIVFDEATSALDNATERDVMAAVDALPGDKTILLIAHRLSTVRRCDRIIVLDKGQLVGFAPWDVLIAENPSFQKIANVHDAA